MSKLVDSYTSDNELFARIQDGDEGAFTFVYERYNKLIYVLAYRYLMDEDRAKDVVQYVFVRLWEYRREWSIGVSLKNFLFTMAKNYMLNLIRNENTALEKQYEMAQRTLEYEDDLVEKLERREQMSLFIKSWLNFLNRRKNMSYETSGRCVKSGNSGTITLVNKYSKESLCGSIEIIAS